jgi:hypothetical protein
MLASNQRETASETKDATKIIFSHNATSGGQLSAILSRPATAHPSSIPLNLTTSTDVSASLLLTPTTYSRLEQTLLELNQQLVPHSESSSEKSKAAMAIKREHDNNNESDDDDDDDTFTGDDSISGDDWASVGGGGKMARFDVAVDYSLSSSNHSSSELSAGTSTGKKSATPRRHTGPRKPRTHEKLSPEEEERRRMRRERNKHAAAKCRQKRVDLTNQLLAETEKLESEQAKLQNEIKSFQREKDELEFILEAHRLHCGAGKLETAMVAASVAPATAVAMTAMPTALKVVEGIDAGRNVVFVVSTGTEAAPVNEQSTATTGGIRRPTSLTTTRLIGNSAPRQIAGVAITTPSAGLFTLGLESMIDGHTGLTPITGLPVSFAGLSTPVVAIPASVSSMLLSDAAAVVVADNGGNSAAAALATVSVTTSS